MGKKTKVQPVKKRQCVHTPYLLEWPELDNIKNTQILDEIRRTFNSVSLDRSKDRRRGGKKEREKKENSKKKEAQKPSANKTEINKNWKQLSVGLNSVTKQMERGQLSVALVCTSAKIETISQHLMIQSATRKIPLVRVGGLSEVVRTLLGLRTVLAMGFKKNIKDDSVFRVLVDFLLSSARPFHVPWVDDSGPTPMRLSTTRPTKKSKARTPSKTELDLQESHVEQKETSPLEDIGLIDKIPQQNLLRHWQTPDTPPQAEAPTPDSPLITPNSPLVVIRGARSRIIDIARKNSSAKLPEKLEMATQDEFISFHQSPSLGEIDGSCDTGEPPRKRVRTMSKSSSGNASPLYEPGVSEKGRYFTQNKTADVEVDEKAPEFIRYKQSAPGRPYRPYGPVAKVLGNQKLKMPLKMIVFGARGTSPAPGTHTKYDKMRQPKFKQDYKPKHWAKGNTNITLQPPVVAEFKNNPNKCKKKLMKKLQQKK